MPAVDLILTNADVITMDTNIKGADFVAISGDKIFTVGKGNDWKLMSGPLTKVIDCSGKTVIPGFIDAHCHLFGFLRNLLSLDISPEKVKSIEDIKMLISHKVKTSQPGNWIICTGYNEFYLAEKRHPTRWDLDQVSPDNPVLLAHRSLHSCVLNTAGLRIARIDSETPELPGTLIDRDPVSGEPNGILFEMLPYIREKVLPPFTQEEIDQGARLINDHFLSNGVTSCQDASVTNNPERWKILYDLYSSDRFQPRVTMMTGKDNLRRFLCEGRDFWYGERLRLWGLKILLSESTGSLHPSAEEITEIVRDMTLQKIPVAIHAITREMVEAVVSAYESIKIETHTNKLRLRIEHCSECPPDLMERIKYLKPIVVSQPLFIYYSGDRYLSIIEKGSIPWLYRFKTIAQNGVTIAAGSDCPVVPTVSPLLGIYSAVTRRTRNRQEFNPEERVSPFQALTMYTINAAYAVSEENIKGSITPWKLADLVVLSDNPLKVEPDGIKDIKVYMTIIGGKIVWQ